ncbi:polyphenol oxidase I, chloroplastic-like [Salvia miltiorrhiza]|uniref:polyphenol oxidase I, chloroplastic-like n=1 Tax=Salvia miltiorrhiza TaxID=226208 RepID=UPI0025AD6CF4|nr:polyphenol oxidase I, chloroplastic-like [Salvia miltiorrhiza]
MASLQSSFTAVAATTNSPFRKPSQLGSRRSHGRFQVSCSSGGGGSGRIDRRNMLLGLGGLYGAGSAIRKAEALPILPPDLSTCDPEGAYTTRNQEVISLDVNCCPPYTDVQSDYKLPRFTKPRVRPAAHRLTPEYVRKYELAIRKMKELDVTDPDDPRGFTQQANIHCAYCNGPYDQVDHPGIDIQVHNSWIFFPFHRWYLYFFERIMGELIGDPDFALPYWNWDNPRGMQMPRPFDREESPLYDVNRDPTHRPPALVALAITTPPITDPVTIIENNLTQMYKEMIGDVESAIDFMGDPYVSGDLPPPRAKGGLSEGGSHGGVHVWTGNPANDFREDMGNFYSAGRDPLFYAHHANVDRMWTIWKTIPSVFPKDINDLVVPNPDDFNNAAFMFYDEKKNLVRVKVADCLDHTKMGYVYEHSETPWTAYRPPRREVPVNIEDLSKRAESGDNLFPLTLNKTHRVLVPKPTKGKADEVLVLENIITDSSKLVRFDVFVNDEDDKPEDLARAEFAGSFTQIPHRVRAAESANDLRLNLRELYENINIADDDFIVVTIVPHINGDDVTIGGIKIIPRVTA